MDKHFDVVVIGAGPGGYIAAIRAAQLGFTVACVDAWTDSKGKSAPGGTCTNAGCIPSKALLQSSDHYEHAAHTFAAHGVEITVLGLNLECMITRKNDIVRQNNDGILYLFRKNGVTFFHGWGAFAEAKEGRYCVRVTGQTEEIITGTHVVIATGSSPRPLLDMPFDEQKVLSNVGALSMSVVPKKLGIVGAGVVGLETGSVWRRLGAEVTLLESMAEFLPAVDRQIAEEAHRQFIRQGLVFEFGVSIGKVNTSKKGVTVEYTDLQNKTKTAVFDSLIVSIGRMPNVSGLNAESVGLGMDENGFIGVDANCRTNLPNVWAVGDVVRGPMLAHKAEEEGMAVAERIAGQRGHVDFNTIPWVIYTAPEIAWVGRNEQQLKATGVAYKVGTFPFLANGRARAMGDTVGMVKVLADATTDEVLGVHILGPMASELIGEAVMAVAFRATAEDIARICHAHPTLSEAMREAALAVDGRSLNY
ncbi:MAG: dihydrolipoyl dehydrogenase [Oxalobacter sp.]|nr:MAG: dihydrolipoyl dehydrogenase [Oxalobacter sp.]